MHLDSSSKDNLYFLDVVRSILTDYESFFKDSGVQNKNLKTKLKIRCSETLFNELKTSCKNEALFSKNLDTFEVNPENSQFHISKSSQIAFKQMLTDWFQFFSTSDDETLLKEHGKGLKFVKHCYMIAFARDFSKFTNLYETLIKNEPIKESFDEERMLHRFVLSKAFNDVVQPHASLTTIEKSEIEKKHDRVFWTDKPAEEFLADIADLKEPTFSLIICLVVASSYLVFADSFGNTGKLYNDPFGELVFHANNNYINLISNYIIKGMTPELTANQYDVAINFFNYVKKQNKNNDLIKKINLHIGLQPEIEYYYTFNPFLIYSDKPTKVDIFGYTSYLQKKYLNKQTDCDNLIADEWMDMINDGSNREKIIFNQSKTLFWQAMWLDFYISIFLACLTTALVIINTLWLSLPTIMLTISIAYCLIGFIYGQYLAFKLYPTQQQSTGLACNIMLAMGVVTIISLTLAMSYPLNAIILPISYFLSLTPLIAVSLHTLTQNKSAEEDAKKTSSEEKIETFLNRLSLNGMFSVRTNHASNDTHDLTGVF